MATVALNRLIWGAFGLGTFSWVVSQSAYVVPAGHKAVVFSRSQGIMVDKVKGEGLNFVIPFWQWPLLFDVRTTPKTIKTETPTKDLQRVNIGLRVLYRPSVEDLPWLYKKYGIDYAERVLPGIGQEALKSVVAQYQPVELITQRAAVSKQIRETLTIRAKEYYIVLDDVAITDLSFGPEFSQAIERKQVAQQDAERAKWAVKKAEQERLAAVIVAEGESESAKLITAATASYGAALVELRRIEAAKEVAKSLSNSEKVSYLPSGEGNNNLLISVPRT